MKGHLITALVVIAALLVYDNFVKDAALKMLARK